MIRRDKKFYCYHNWFYSYLESGQYLRSSSLPCSKLFLRRKLHRCLERKHTLYFGTAPKRCLWLISVVRPNLRCTSEKANKLVNMLKCWCICVKIMCLNISTNRNIYSYLIKITWNVSAGMVHNSISLVRPITALTCLKK